jgi:nucleotide-binding universal stress UspA family protein
MIKTILAATDLSENAAVAARYAQQLAQALDAAVIAAHVIEIGLSSWLHSRYEDVVDDEKRARAEAKIRNWYAQHAGAAPADVDMRADSCANGLKAAAAETHADLLVMAPSGKGAFAQFVVGSRLQEVASHPPCALAVAMDRPVKSVSVATDFSEASAHAVQWAWRFAQGLGASLRVIHVAELPDLPAFDEDLFGDSFNTFYEESEARLKALVDQTLPAGHDAQTAVITGQPEEVLDADARDKGIDAIVLGQTGHDSVIGDILGSVPRGLINRMPCTVIVVPGVEAAQG